MENREMSEIKEDKELCESVNYRKAGYLEGSCRTCSFAVFTNDGVYCDLHAHLVFGSNRCDEQE